MMNTPKSRFIAQFEKRVLCEMNPDRAVELAELFALVMLAEMPDRYEATEIEQHVMSLFQNVELDKPPQKLNQNLHVITTPYATGGHTRLMENLATAEETSPCLLVTGEYTEQGLTRARKVFEECFFVNQKLPAVERISGLLQCMAQFERVVLHIHQYDICSVVASSLAKEYGCKIFYVNHADHTFSYGNSVADVWFQLGVHGAKTDEKRKLGAQKAFLGVASGVAADFESVNFDNRPVTVIASAGTSYKFRPLDGDRAYFELIERLLEKYPEAKFYALGVNPLRDFWWWPLKFRFWSRVGFKGLMPFYAYMKFMSNITLYVDSYPYHGGTAFSQQLAQGRRCIGLWTQFEGYSPAEQLKHQNVEEVIAGLETPPSKVQLQKILKQTIFVNSLEQVVGRYLHALNGRFENFDWSERGLINLCPKFKPERKRLSTQYSLQFLVRLLRVDFKLFSRFVFSSSPEAGLAYLARFLANSISYFWFKSGRLR